MKFKFTLAIILLGLLSSLIACSSSTPTVEPTVEPTLTPPAASPTQTDSPTAAPGEVTPIPQASPTPPVKGAALVNLNLRQGPGQNYGIAGSLPANSEITIVGRNADSSWLSAETDDGTVVWVTGDPELIKIDPARLGELSVIEAPPLAYNANDPKVNEILNLIPLVIHHGGTFTCASHGGLNQLLPEVVEGHVIGPHANDFVFGTQDNVLFRITNGTLELIRENPIARFEGGAKTLPLDQALQMFERGEIVWNGTFGQSPARGVTGCDQSPP